MSLTDRIRRVRNELRAQRSYRQIVLAAWLADRFRTRIDNLSIPLPGNIDAERDVGRRLNALFGDDWFNHEDHR